MRFLSNIFNLFVCTFVGHHFRPWYRKPHDPIGIVRRKCRDCGKVERHQASYDFWEAVPKEDLLL